MKTIFSVLLLMTLIACASAPQNPWAEFQTPTEGPSQSIGNYTAGCLKGAESLYPDGVGYHTMRISRRRFYGHSDLILFIESLGKFTKTTHLPELLIGDLAQPRGGPLSGGHNSHQTGLDVDIWFSPPPSSQLSLDTRENLSAKKLIWNDPTVKTLKFASNQPRVDRIFVNPWIKKKLCEFFPNQSWLQKIRPWWGHEDHFHVRLKCPENSPNCLPQAALPPSSGCDESLAWWFTKEATLPKKSSPVKPPELPLECF